MTEIVRAPATALDAVDRLADLSDAALDKFIANESVVEVVAGVMRLARIERGRRTENYERAGKVLPSSTFSQAEKNVRSEEMLVARWYDYDPDAEQFVIENGWRKCVTEARNRGFGNAPIHKKRLATGVAHPAPFSDPILAVIDDALPAKGVILDPFAGTGRVHELAGNGRHTIGVEIEEEWATLHPDTRIGNALDLGAAGIAPETVDAIATSPTYGNRLADHHRASDPDSRRSYTHDLGHPLAEDNSGAMQWGEEYRRFHLAAYWEAIRALKPGGTFVVNISDHIRDGVLQPVHEWHIWALAFLGLEWVSVQRVATKRLKQGRNAEARADVEYVITLRKPDGSATAAPSPNQQP